MSGKWSEPSVPHKGWTCDSVEDLEAPSMTCEMCEAQEIRYVHHMSHPDYPTGLAVGCVCAEHMEDDCVGPRRREQAMKNAATRRRKWSSRKWREMADKRLVLNADRIHIEVYEEAAGVWRGRLMEPSTLRSVRSNRLYATAEAAKLATFDALMFLKAERGWGKGPAQQGDEP